MEKKPYILAISIISLMICLNTRAQSPVVSLEDADRWKVNDSRYFKDLNNVLDTFEGVWLFTDGDTSLKIVLKKEEQVKLGTYYIDMIVGEYQYIQDGVEKINSLAQIDVCSGRQHNISGSALFKDCAYLPVADCQDGEKRLYVSVMDRGTQSAFNILMLHVRNINGRPALKAVMSGMTVQSTFIEGEEIPKTPIRIIDEDMVFYKVPL